jgi:hypothetical protein
MRGRDSDRILRRRFRSWHCTQLSDAADASASEKIAIDVAANSVQLRLSSGFDFCHCLQILVKARHQLRCAAVFYIPQTGDHRYRTGVDECSWKSDQLVAAGQFAKTCFTGAEYDQAGL